MLAILGLPPREERLYEALVSQPPMTSAQIDRVAAAHEWTGPTGSALARLDDLALVTPVPGPWPAPATGTGPPHGASPR